MFLSSRPEFGAPVFGDGHKAAEARRGPLQDSVALKIRPR
jgi:hypothetical protein